MTNSPSECRRSYDTALGFWRLVRTIAHDILHGIWNFIDDRAIIRRVAFIWVLWMTSIVIYWAMDFADNHSDMDGLKMAAIIGSVLTPWNLMQAAIWKFNSDSAQAMREEKRGDAK